MRRASADDREARPGVRGLEGRILVAHDLQLRATQSIGRIAALPKRAMKRDEEPATGAIVDVPQRRHDRWQDRKSTRLNSSHLGISYAVFCLKKKNDRARGRGNVEDSITDRH